MSGLVFMSSVFIRSILMLVLTTSELTLSSLDFVSIKSFLEATKTKSFYSYQFNLKGLTKELLPSACFEKSVLRLVKSPFISSNLALVTVFMMLISVLVAKLCIVRSNRLEVDSSCAKRSIRIKFNSFEFLQPSNSQMKYATPFTFLAKISVVSSRVSILEVSRLKFKFCPTLLTMMLSDSWLGMDSQSLLNEFAPCPVDRGA